MAVVQSCGGLVSYGDARLLDRSVIDLYAVRLQVATGLGFHRWDFDLTETNLGTDL